MFQYDLSHQATVMTAVNNFVELALNLDLSHDDFILHLCQLIPAFKTFDQDGVKYHASVQVFKYVVHALDQSRKESSIEEYLTQLSLSEIKGLRHILVNYRSQILEEIRLFRLQELDNQNSFLAYVQQIIQDHYKVLVVRVDLGYLKDSMFDISVHDFYRNIESLCKYLKDKNGCFKHLLGYGLALEQGSSKGYHAHLMLIYNGSERCKDWFLANEVIQEWQTITDGLGYGMNNNTAERKEHFARRGLLGIGMIHRSNLEEIQNALTVARYLVQPEKYLQQMLVKPIGKRTFFKGIYREHGRNYKTVRNSHVLGDKTGIWSHQDVLRLSDDSVIIHP